MKLGLYLHGLVRTLKYYVLSVDHVHCQSDLFALSLFWIKRTLFRMNHFQRLNEVKELKNFLFRATREYTEAGIEQATVALRCLGDNSPEPRRRAVPG